MRSFLVQARRQRRRSSLSLMLQSVLLASSLVATPWLFAWMDSTMTMRVAMRNGTDPNTKINWMGFWCARDGKDSGESQEAKPQQISLR